MPQSLLDRIERTRKEIEQSLRKTKGSALRLGEGRARSMRKSTRKHKSMKGGKSRSTRLVSRRITRRGSVLPLSGGRRKSTRAVSRHKSRRMTGGLTLGEGLQRHKSKRRTVHRKANNALMIINKRAKEIMEDEGVSRTEAVSMASAEYRGEKPKSGGRHRRMSVKHRSHRY